MKSTTDNNSLIIGKEYFFGEGLKNRGIYLGKNDFGYPIFKPTNETKYFVNKEGNVSCITPVRTSPATQEAILTATFFNSHFGIKVCLN